MILLIGKLSIAAGDFKGAQMTLSRRELIAYGAAGAVASLTVGTANSKMMSEEAKQTSVPAQVSSDRGPGNRGGRDVFRGDMTCGMI